MGKMEEKITIEVAFNSGVKGVIRYESDNDKDTEVFLDSFTENWENSRIWSVEEFGATLEVCGTYLDTVDLGRVLGYKYC